MRHSRVAGCAKQGTKRMREGKPRDKPPAAPGARAGAGALAGPHKGGRGRLQGKRRRRGASKTHGRLIAPSKFSLGGRPPLRRPLAAGALAREARGGAGASALRALRALQGGRAGMLPSRGRAGGRDGAAREGAARLLPRAGVYWGRRAAPRHARAGREGRAPRGRGGRGGRAPRGGVSVGSFPCACYLQGGLRCTGRPCCKGPAPGKHTPF
jgi:hypothetical protein